MKTNLSQYSWWKYLYHDIKELLEESILLCERVKGWDEKFHDYSFVVFPAAKAYEGFLKKLLLDLQLINWEDYKGKRFRIGKALNPALEGDARVSEGVYDQLADIGGRNFAEALWETWRTCRNLLFHWFPDEKNAIDFEEARYRVKQVVDTLDLVYKTCKMEEN